MIDLRHLLGFLDVMERIKPSWAILHPEDAEAAQSAHDEALQSVRVYVTALVERVESAA